LSQREVQTRLDRTSFGKRLGSYAESISLPAQPVV
ncbi:hypothetical protein PSYMO_38158, partial [Pseudomonas amygdali pv. mori str. 301020]